jgi:hypothetical protein
MCYKAISSLPPQILLSNPPKGGDIFLILGGDSLIAHNRSSNTNFNHIFFCINYLKIEFYKGFVVQVIIQN